VDLFGHSVDMCTLQGVALYVCALQAHAVVQYLLLLDVAGATINREL